MGLGIWRQLSPSLRCILTGSFLMSVGFYCVIPSLALYMNGRYGWSMALAGLLLGVRQFTQQGLTLFGGALSDRIGWRRAIVLGTFFRGLGFILFPFCQSTAQFFMVTIFTSLAGALTDPPLKAFIEHDAPPAIRSEVIALRDVLNNVAFLLAALVGAALHSLDLKYLFVFSGFMYVGTSALSFIMLAPTPARSRSWTEGMITVATDRSFLAYSTLLIGYFYLYCQLYLLVPRFALTSGLGPYGLSIIYGAITITVVVTQVPLTRQLKPYPHRLFLIGAGGFIMGTSLLGLNLSATAWTSVVSAVLFGLGTAMSLPVIFEVVGTFARSNGHLGAYFGLNGTAIGVGGLLSTSIGGLTADLAGTGGHSLYFPGALCFLIGAAQFASYYFLGPGLLRQTACSITFKPLRPG